MVAWMRLLDPVARSLTRLRELRAGRAVAPFDDLSLPDLRGEPRAAGRAWDGRTTTKPDDESLGAAYGCEWRSPGEVCDDGFETESLCLTEDSLLISEDSDIVQAAGLGGRPPLSPADLTPVVPASAFDGNWTLSGHSGARLRWAESLTIQGSYVEMSDGRDGQLFYTARGPLLFDGLLRRKGAALVRQDPTGDVQIFLRSHA